MSDDEFRLTPIEDEGEVAVAPELPFAPNVRWIPVICAACKTRLYAAQSQVGMMKLCPDCGRKTPIVAVPERLVVTIEIDKNGGYVVHDPEIAVRPVAQPCVDYGLMDDEHHDSQTTSPKTSKSKEERRDNDRLTLPPPESQPYLERMLDGLLTDSHEAQAKRKHQQRYQDALRVNQQIHRETKDSQSDHRKTAEYQKEQAETNPHDAWNNYRPGDEKSPPSSPPVAVHPALAALDDLLPPALTPNIPSKNDGGNYRENVVDEEENENETSHGSVVASIFQRDFYSPFFAVQNRHRFVLLIIAGLIGHFFGGKSQTIIWEGLSETGAAGPGHILGWGEMAQLFTTFFVGTSITLLWAILVLMIGVSIFSQTANGRREFHNRLEFDLDCGLSSLFWSLVFLWLSSYPGWMFWYIVSWNHSAMTPYLIPMLLCSQFFLFPVLLLAVYETDSFSRGFPFQTTRSVARHPILWLKFYIAAVLLLFPVILYGGTVMYLRLFYSSEWWTQSMFYFLGTGACTAMFFTFTPLLYFRLVGFLAADGLEDYV